MKPARILSTLIVAAVAFAMPLSAGATLEKTGAWPDHEKKVDLEFDGKPSEGLKKLAKEADWSLVVSNAVAVDGSGGDVHVDVEDQPADAVLEALFVGRDVVAYRNGTLITITPSVGGSVPSAGLVPTPPIVPPPPPLPSPPSVGDTRADTSTNPVPPPIPSVRGEDRSVFGSNLVIHKGEIVHNVTVTGGSLKVEGTVTGDLVVAGGPAKVMSGGRVVGNATVFGGSLKIENNGRVDGDVSVAGGVLKRDDGAIVGGRIHHESDDAKVNVTAGDHGAPAEENDDATSSTRSRLSRAVHDFGQSLTKMALLFVLGCVLLALLAPRMERVRVEIASRPMRSFALGVVGTLVGSIGAIILLAVLCVTVIGIPVAILGVLAAILVLYGGIASALTTFGAAVAGHRTQNPYIHLLVGCAAFLVLSSIPSVGGIVTFVVTMIAVGALLTTRAGGLIERSRRPPSTGLV